MTEVATIILSRNMPDVTDRLVEQFQSFNNGETDVFVVESGSEREKRSRYCTWWADWDEALRDGLRYPRGFNYGLSCLLREGRFADYDYFFLVCNDVEFNEPLVPVLLDEMQRHPRVGILSPCNTSWPERGLIGENSTRYVWHSTHLAWMLRRSFVETVMNRDHPAYMNLLYDGSNFRGHDVDRELIIKGYINEYATALTTKALISENTELLRSKADVMRTDPYEMNLRMVVEEGREWMRRKYGFTTRVHMQIYATLFYDRFFTLYPELAPLRLLADPYAGQGHP